MKILDRYILKEISGHCWLALAAFTFVLTAPELFRLSELLARQSVSLVTLAELAATILPGKLVWTIPMAVLVGLLVGWSRLAVDSEIVALEAAGVSLSRLLVPAGLFAGAGFLLALGTSLWWAPLSARQFRALQEELAAGEVSYEIQARVFDERFPHVTLYVQEVESGAARWNAILVADTSRPATTRLTLAEAGIVVNEPARRRLHLHLLNGSAHEHPSNQPERYSVSTFTESDLLLPWAESRITPVELRRNAERTLGELWAASRTSPEWRNLRADFHRRLALPAVCLVFALLAVPLGKAGSRSGRAGGVVGAFLFFVGYYSLFVFTDRLAREAVVSPWLGVWVANLVFGVLGGVLLIRSRRPPSGSSWRHGLREFLFRRQSRPALTTTSGRTRSRSDLPRLLDLYMLRGFWFYFLLLLGSFLLLYQLFNLLELVDDIARNQVGWRIVTAYLFYLAPQALYWMVPYAALVAVLVELGLLSKHNELIAIKAGGISLFRLAVPVLAAGVLLSLGLFLLDLYVLPYANQRQEAVRNQIRGRPPQTVFQPQRKWIFGQGPRLFNYRFFDPRENLFGELSVFELWPDRFALRRRIHARHAHWQPAQGKWMFEEGWQREFDSERAGAFRTFAVATFPEIAERPEYFKKEILESAQMNFRELGGYIAELRQGGFDVGRLQVHWHRKFAFPLMAAVMVLLAFPFGLTVGRRGAVGGLAVGLGVGITYWLAGAFFEQLGNIQLLPPLLAGWGPDLLFAFVGVYWLLHIHT